MLSESRDAFLAQQGTYIAHKDDKHPFPFTQHAQFAALADILSRRHQHHAILCADFSPKLYKPFLEAFLSSLAQGSTPSRLRHAEILFLTLETAVITDIKQIAIEKEFEALRETLTNANKPLIIALTRADVFAKELKKPDERFLRRQLDLLSAHPRCRLILMTSSKDAAPHKHLSDQFALLALKDPSESDVLALLQQQRTELEQFHHVVISDELLTQAYAFAERYLSTSQALDQALLLLDSSAARAASKEQHDHDAVKPALTTATLINTLSAWTQIPTSHLPATKITQSEFIQGMQQRLFGQETAVSLIGRELLQAQSRLSPQAGPVCSFLFAGPVHTGKKTMATVLVDQLFKQPQLLYFVQPTVTLRPIIEINVQQYQNKLHLALADAIRQKPYAIFLFQNFDQASASAQDDMRELLTTGYLHDAEGHPYNFCQSIVILTMDIDASVFADLVEPAVIDDDIYTMDLMQLVMNDQKQEAGDRARHYSADEINDKLQPAIAEKLPISISRCLQTVPFLPLSKSAIEKILRLQLKKLGKQLMQRHGVELGYAPEVIRYLTNEVCTRRDVEHHAINPNTALKPLYFCVDQALLNQSTNKHASNQLFLQLNERGHSLRCDWLAAPAEPMQQPVI